MNKILVLKFLAVAVLFIPVTAFSHALLVSPVPRSEGGDANPAEVIDTSGNETGPCAPNYPAVPCTSSACTYSAGQAMPVTFEAVIQHNGPFTLSLGPAAATSTTSQASFTILLAPAVPPTTPYVQTEAQNADGTFTEVQKATVSTTTPDVYKEYVVIPANTTPGNYTLQLQQADAPVTYFTCADITVVAASASPTPSPSVSASASPSPTPSATGTGPLSSQGLGTTPNSTNGGAKMASCGLVRDISDGPGRGPGAAALIISLPLMMMMLLMLRVRRAQLVRVRSRR